MVILRYTLRDLLHSRHTLPYLHYRVVVQCLFGSQDRSSQPAVFAYWFRGMRSPKWPGGSLNFQFSGISVVCPGGNIPPSGTKTSRSAEDKAEGKGSKNFASRSLGVYCQWILFWFLDLSILAMGETVLYIGCWLSIYSLLENFFPALQGTAA